jgi:hypothetical protein
MSVLGIVTLSDLIDQTRQESDQVNSQFVTDLEVATYLSNSYKELYDMLVGAYGEDYYVSKRASFVTNNNLDIYPLPDGTITFTDDNGNPFIAPPFYKLLGLDYQLSPNNPQGYITLKSFPFSERNKYAVPNFASFWGFTNLRYRILGNNLWLTPIPASGQPLRIYYIPRPINLVSQIVGTTTISTNTLTTTDVLTPQVGMSIFGPGIPANTTITAVGVGTITLSNTVLNSTTNGVFKMFSYTTQVDGISGWEEYPVVDAAIKIMGKEESETSALMMRKEALKKRIQDIAANRDPGTAARTADVSSGNLWDGGGEGNNGFGGGTY